MFTKEQNTMKSKAPKGATHVSLLYEKHDSEETIAAILRVVKAVRTDQPLSP